MLENASDVCSFLACTNGKYPAHCLCFMAILFAFYLFFNLIFCVFYIFNTSSNILISRAAPVSPLAQFLHHFKLIFLHLSMFCFIISFSFCFSFCIYIIFMRFYYENIIFIVKYHHKRKCCAWPTPQI